MRKLITGTVFALALLVSAPGVTQDFGMGFEAYNRGDCATGLREWKPLAEQGSITAIFGRPMVQQGISHVVNG